MQDISFPFPHFEGSDSTKEMKVTLRPMLTENVGGEQI